MVVIIGVYPCLIELRYLSRQNGVRSTVHQSQFALKDASHILSFARQAGELHVIARTQAVRHGIEQCTQDPRPHEFELLPKLFPDAVARHEAIPL